MVEDYLQLVVVGFCFIWWAPCVRTAWLYLTYGWLTTRWKWTLFKGQTFRWSLTTSFFGCKISSEIRSEINLDLVQWLLFSRHLFKGYWPLRDASRCIEGVLCSGDNWTSYLLTCIKISVSKRMPVCAYIYIYIYIYIYSSLKVISGGYILRYSIYIIHYTTPYQKTKIKNKKLNQGSAIRRI